MKAFFTLGNISTFIVCLIIAIIIVAVTVYMIRHKGGGCSGCNGNCNKCQKYDAKKKNDGQK